MAAFHLTEAGVRPCKAKQRACPLGGAHFDDRAAAQRSYELKLEKEFSNAPEETVAIPVDFGTLTLTAGDLSEASARHALANGLCGDLAQALLEETGTEPYFVCYGFNTAEELAAAFQGTPEELRAWATHVVVESPSRGGSFLDSYGVHEAQDIEAFYGAGARLLKGTPAMLSSYSTGVSSHLKSFVGTLLAYDRDKVSYTYGQ